MTSEAGGSAGPQRAPPVPSRGGPSNNSKTGPLAAPSERGATFIEDNVVSIIARHAAEGVEGIHRLGESTFRSLVSWMGRHHGVDAEVGQSEAAVDIEVVVEFGYPIRQLTRDLRERIIEAVESMTGRIVVEVNIYVIDVHVGGAQQRHRRQLE